MNPYATVLIPEPMDYFAACGATSMCEAKCNAEYSAFDRQLVLEAVLHSNSPVTKNIERNTESMLFVDLDEDAYTPMNIMAMVELSDCRFVPRMHVCDCRFVPRMHVCDCRFVPRMHVCDCRFVPRMHVCDCRFVPRSSQTHARALTHSPTITGPYAEATATCSLRSQVPTSRTRTRASLWLVSQATTP
jgi:hypothetical protein